MRTFWNALGLYLHRSATRLKLLFYLFFFPRMVISSHCTHWYSLGTIQYYITVHNSCNTVCFVLVSLGVCTAPHFCLLFGSFWSFQTTMHYYIHWELLNSCGTVCFTWRSLCQTSFSFTLTAIKSPLAFRASLCAAASRSITATPW